MRRWWRHRRPNRRLKHRNPALPVHGHDDHHHDRDAGWRAGRLRWPRSTRADWWRRWWWCLHRRNRWCWRWRRWGRRRRRRSLVRHRVEGHDGSGTLVQRHGLHDAGSPGHRHHARCPGLEPRQRRDAAGERHLPSQLNRWRSSSRREAQESQRTPGLFGSRERDGSRCHPRYTPRGSQVHRRGWYRPGEKRQSPVLPVERGPSPALCEPAGRGPPEASCRTHEDPRFALPGSGLPSPGGRVAPDQERGPRAG